MNIYVGNLSYRMDDTELEGVFAEFGQVISCKIINDRETGRSKGFAFVEMDNADSGKAAIETLDGKEVEGRSLKVNEARPRESRPRREY
ncbi:MAG: RNA-binding protein [Campylobacteraceae bacterium]|nr:RNA-binding protein [Campylobacteraceae bacterium]